MQVRLLGFLLLGLAAPLAAQEQESLVQRWTLTVTAGPVLGGPSGGMTQRFLDENWTEVGCSPKGTDCHSNPVRNKPMVHLEATLSRNLGRRLEIQAIGAVGSLGRSVGRRDGYDVTAEWSSATVGAVLALKPFEAFQIGAGPLLGMLNSSTPGTVPNSVMRGGMLFTSAFRSSRHKPMFLSLSASYHLLGKRWEGPWPARKGTWFGEQGPSRLEANYSHLNIGLGLGARF